MSMKTILVPMEPHEGMGTVLETALLLAKKRGSYIEGFPLRFGISEFVAVDPAGSIPLESYRQESQEEAAQARKLFDSFMQRNSVPQSAGPSAGLSCGWLDDAPEGESFVGSYGRVFDITVLSRPDANTIGLHNRAIDSGLFESGRPILLSPPVAPRQIATNVMIHWNCSTEQARATTLAMPLLHDAQQVEAGEARHADIGEDDLGVDIIEHGQRLGGARGDMGGEAGQAQPLLEGGAHHFFVVDDENGEVGHCFGLCVIVVSTTTSFPRRRESIVASDWESKSGLPPARE
jgi:hypothetical protein